MAVARKSRQVLTYLRPTEAERLDARVDEAEVSRAEWVRDAITEKLDRDDAADARLEAMGEVTVEAEASSARIDEVSLG